MGRDPRSPPYAPSAAVVLEGPELAGRDLAVLAKIPFSEFVTVLDLPFNRTSIYRWIGHLFRLGLLEAGPPVFAKGQKRVRTFRRKHRTIKFFDGKLRFE